MEATMGMYVVSKLAARHDMAIEIVPGIPGLTVQVTIPADILEHNLADPPTYSRDFRRAHPHAGGQAVAEKVDRVVDLTETGLTEAAEDPDVRDVGEPGSLPVRSPGRALGETITSSHSVAEGESALGIKAALAAYDQGRRAAESERADDRTKDDLNPWEGPDE